MQTELISPMTSAYYRRALMCYRFVFTNMVREAIAKGSKVETEAAISRLLDFNGHHTRARRLRAVALRRIAVKGEG